MSTNAVDPVRGFVLRHLAEPLAAVGREPDDVPDDLDLLAEGVLDSLGLIGLIGAIEDHYRVVVDLEDIDADDLGVVGPFCRYLERQVHASGAG